MKRIGSYQFDRYKEIVRNLDLFPPHPVDPRRIDPRLLRFNQMLLEMIRDGLILPFRDEEHGGTVAFQITAKGEAARQGDAAEEVVTSPKPPRNAEA